ncbi:hypothetical protein JCM3765_002909 [Sporobolomyces pararoseus]
MTSVKSTTCSRVGSHFQRILGILRCAPSLPSLPPQTPRPRLDLSASTLGLTWLICYTASVASKRGSRLAQIFLKSSALSIQKLPLPFSPFATFYRPRPSLGMSTVIPASVLYAHSEATRHLSLGDRNALAQAVEKANEDFYDDKIGIQVRKDDLNRTIQKIKKRACKNGDDESGLNRWEQKVWRMFSEAGETEYAHETLGEYLESVDKRVRTGVTMLDFNSRRDCYIVKNAFKPVVMVSGYAYSTGFDIRLLEIQQQLRDFYDSALDRIKNGRNLSDIGKEHYEATLKIYVRHLDTILSRRVYNGNDQEILVHWERVYRTVRVLRNLLESNVPLFQSYSIAPIFGLDNLNERCNLWTPQVPEWYLHPSTSQYCLPQR